MNPILYKVPITLLEKYLHTPKEDHIWNGVAYALGNFAYENDPIAREEITGLNKEIYEMVSFPR